jgi:hypothetical protein
VNLVRFFVCEQFLDNEGWGGSGSFWVQSRQTVFCFVLFGIIRLQETFEKKMRAWKSARSPQYGYSLAQQARFRFSVSKYFLFCFIWDYKTSGAFRKKKLGLGDQQKVLNIDIPWHNWLVLGSESPNIFRLVLFGIIKLQETFEKKNEGWEISRKS